MSRRDEHALSTRAAVLDCAGQLFADQGFASTSIEQIATAARVTKGAVYHHFTDKGDLFAALFAAECNAVLRHIQEAAPPGVSGIDAITVGIARMFDEYADNPRLRALSTQASVAIGDERRREIQAGASIPSIKAILDELQAQGQLRGANTKTGAEMILELIFFAATCYARNLTDDGRHRIESALIAIINGLAT